VTGLNIRITELLREEQILNFRFCHSRVRTVADMQHVHRLAANGEDDPISAMLSSADELPQLVGKPSVFARKRTPRGQGFQGMNCRLDGR
jgi:hypothetical protein